MPETKVRSGQLVTTLSSKTIDSTNTINTDLTKLAIAGGTAGQVLSTNGSGVLSFITASGGGGATTQNAFKATDQTTNTTNNVYSNDSALTIVVGVTGYYSVEIYVVSDAINNIFLGITGVAGYAKVSSSTANSGFNLNATAVGNAGSGVSFTKISGIINCNTGDNIRLAYYKHFGGIMTILAGSYMKIEKAN